MSKNLEELKKDKSIEDWQLQGYPESEPKKRTQKEGIEELLRICRGMIELKRSKLRYIIGSNLQV